MSGPSRLPTVGDLKRPLQPQPDKSSDSKQGPVVLLNGLPLRSTYLAKCRLCLSNNFGQNSVSIMDARFSNMLKHVFRFSITFQKGLSMNVCSKCYKGVELFYYYTFQVLANQRTMEKSIVPDQKLEKSNTRATAQAKRVKQEKPPAMNREQVVTDVVNIVCDDEKRKGKDDQMIIDVDMQCENVPNDEEESQVSYQQSTHNEDIETHFVAVPCIADIFVETETYGFEFPEKRARNPVEDAPFVIEIISASEDEYEVSEDDDSAKNDNYNRTKHAQENTEPTPKALSNVQALSQAKPIPAKVKNVNNLDKSSPYYPAGIMLPFGKTNANKRTNVEISPRKIDKSTINAQSARRSVRNIIREQNAPKTTKALSTKFHKA